MSKYFRKVVAFLVSCFLVFNISSISVAENLSIENNKKLSNVQLEQLVAPIALYPDDLLAQVLIASTYPLEIVQAARWLKNNKNLKGKLIEDAVQKQAWDESIKSISIVPQVLTMMNEKLGWTQQLGDAFLAQQKGVLEAVQRLRKKAQENNNLKATTQQKVITKTVEKQKIIVIESSNPEIIYVPVYNPTVIYGYWSYPAYPPYYWYPPHYVPGRVIWFGVGVTVGAAIWGNCNWGRYNVNINVNRYNNFNRTNIKNTNWKHNNFHRKGVPYRDRAVSRRFNKGLVSKGKREEFRGRIKKEQSIRKKRSKSAPKKIRQKKKPKLTGNKPKKIKRPIQPKKIKRPVKKSNRQQLQRKVKRSTKAFDGMGRGKAVKKYGNRGRSSRNRSVNRQRGGARGRRR